MTRNLSNKSTESGIQAVTWSAVEVNIGIVCASLIALKPLLTHFWPSLLEDREIPSHCLRLPMVQSTCEENGTFSTSTPNSSLPISPVSPSLAKSTSMLQRPSIAATLPGIPQTEGFSVLGPVTTRPTTEIARHGRGH